MAKSGLPRYTLEQYEKYQNLPQWAQDDSDFKSEEDYEHYWTREIHAMEKQYDEQFKVIITQWSDSIEYIEQIPAKSFDVFVPDVAVAQERIPFALASLMEQIAMLYTNYPQPSFVSPDQSQDQFANALNQTTQQELKANGFNSLMFDIGVDIGFACLGVIKTYVDYDQKGAFGQDGKIIIKRIDPLDIFFDPKAKRLNWDDLGYVGTHSYVDLGTARKMFKGARYKIDSYFQTTSDDAKNPDGQFGTNLLSPVPNPIEGNSSLRNRVKVTEVWLKDDRLKFEADVEIKSNTELITDGSGNVVPNPTYDPDKADSYVGPKVDESGYVIGKMVPAYPNGRCIVTVSDKHIVRDFANPYWHNRAPFVFFKGRPSRRLLTVGDLSNICRIDKKLNDLYQRVHIMCQNEIERPMIAETNTFRTPRAWFRMSGQATAVIVKNPGREFGRMPFMEIPQFIWVYIQKLEQALDKIMAMSGIMKGQIAEGAQLGAESVASMQGMGTNVLKMKAELIAEPMKELGYQLMWLERETYPENITINVQMPDGQVQQVPWNDRDASSDYVVDIASTSGLPGTHAANPQSILPMYQQGLIDQAAALQAIRFGGWQDIVNRMKQDKLEKIEAEAAGRATGLRIKEFQKRDGSAGRVDQA